MTRLSPRIILSVFLLLSVFGSPDCWADIGTDFAQWAEINNYEYQADVAKNPLKPPDTSSPRATLTSFLDSTNRAYRILMVAHNENMASPGFLYSSSAVQKAQLADQLFSRSIDCLDFGEMANSYRENNSYESAILLKEILDRTQLPDAVDIPDAKQMEELIANTEWRIPGTRIAIAKVSGGPHSGQYLFTQSSIARIPHSYQLVASIPYKTDRFTTPGFYPFYTSTPGRLLPPKWSRYLPDWSQRVLIDQTLWQWIILVVCLLLLSVVIYQLYIKVVGRARDLSIIQRGMHWIVFCGLAAILVAATYLFLFLQINITSLVLDVLLCILAPILILLLASAVVIGASTLAEIIIASPKIESEGIRASYIRASLGLVGFALGAVLSISGLAYLGVSIVPLLTGVGIGGLAIALAARPTIANVIGSFMIFMDRPFGVGDRVNVLNQNGTVESIGLRSTRIRLPSGHLTSIPNEKMASAEIENIAERPYFKRSFNLALTYSTSPEKVKRAVTILKQLLAAPDIKQEPEHPNHAINRPELEPRVFFSELGKDSLNIAVFYWYHPASYWDYMDHAHELNLQIMKRFKAEQIEMAFPTQTIHLATEDIREATKLTHPKKVSVVN